mgnify:CR=1 FL=1
MAKEAPHIGHLIHEAVLAELASKFPNRLPALHTSGEDLHVLIGQQQVIAYLQRMHDECNALSTPLL